MVAGKRNGEPEFKRILAVKLADLGDLLAVTPALQALRAAHPSARIDLLVPPSSAGLLRGAPYLDRILTFNKFAFDKHDALHTHCLHHATLSQLALRHRH